MTRQHKTATTGRCCLIFPRKLMVVTQNGASSVFCIRCPSAGNDKCFDTLHARPKTCAWWRFHQAPPSKTSGNIRRLSIVRAHTPWRWNSLPRPVSPDVLTQDPSPVQPDPAIKAPGLSRTVSHVYIIVALSWFDTSGWLAFGCSAEAEEAVLLWL